MKLINAEEGKSVEITLIGQVLTVRSFAGDVEMNGWNCDYASAGFQPEYAHAAWAYEVDRYMRMGYTKN
ncbi:hypothetical protein [Streptomyces sp. NPDC007094]|uniref:hypothetical protein n=1 Tax=Streptomyces sp. NPDC007094 TaxID=3155359 RepID=UPI003401AABC